MKRAKHLTLISVLAPFALRTASIFVVILLAVLALRAATAADTTGFEKEKHPPEPGFITRMRRQEEAKKKQAEYDIHVAIPDVDAAERELEGLNTTVSNAMYLAEKAKHGDEGNRGLLQSVVIAAAVLGAGIFALKKVAPQIGFLQNVREHESDTSSGSEDKSFTEFVAAFKVGPKHRPNLSSEISNASTGYSLPNETLLPSPLKLFFEGAPKSIAHLRSLIQEITRASDDAARQKLLVSLCEKIHVLKCMAGLPAVLPAWQLSAALEGLVKQLSEKNRNVTPSTLRTVASAVDLLETLSTPGVRPDLMTNPPIRLLAVDDDALSRHAVSFALKKALNKPDLAENGEAAMALVSQIKYDTIFLDVQMPGMNGFETCTKIHGTELNRETPVVFVTCQSDFDARAKSTLSGGIDLIGKPFLTFEITVKAVTLALRGRLKTPTARDSQKQPASPIVQRPAEKEVPLLIEKEAQNSGTTVAAQTPSTQSSRKSREERRKDRRKRAQANRDSRNRKSRRERSSVEARKDEPVKNALAENETLACSNVVAAAFLAHAPENIQTLHDRLEQICQEPSDEARQELIVELYLAVHSLAAEAHLAQLDTIFRLSAAVEGLLKKLVEEPKGSVIPSLSVIAGTLDVLQDFCEAKLNLNLAEKPARVLVLAADTVARRTIQDAVQSPTADVETADANAGLRLTAEKRFDLIILDVLTPNSDTFSLCSKLRENHKAPMPMVLISDDPNSELLLESIRSNSDRLLQRASSPAEISLVALTSTLAGRFEELKPSETPDEADKQPVVEELAAK